MAQRHKAPFGISKFNRERGHAAGKRFSAERACNEVEFYMGMVTEDQQTFEGLIQHLKNPLQSAETISELISDFYGQTQKNESEDIFADNLQVLT